jgi:hypothetical protein
MTANPTTTNRRAAQWIYPLALAVQTAGAAIVMANGLPIYRQMVLALLFSMFCWTLELERLAKAPHGTESSPQFR